MAKSGDKQINDQTQNGTQNAVSSTAQQQLESAIQNASQTGQTVQNTTRNPWEEAQPLLKSLIDQYSSVNPGVTGQQSSALTRLNTDASGVPNFGATGTDAVNKFFQSSTTPQVGMLSSALDQLKGNIGGTASGAELDPYKTPGFSDAINTMTNDITNRVKGVYAGSGRDPSGAGSFSKSLGRGLTEGIAPVIASQFNTNNANRFNAANRLFDAGGSTAGAITGQEQVPLANSAQGINLAGMLSGLFTNPAQTQLSAANAAQSQPLNNLAGLLGPLLQLGGLGGTTSNIGETAGTTAGTSSGTTNATTSGATSGTTSGTSHGVTSQPQSLLSNILSGGLGGIGLLSALGGSGGASAGIGALAPMLAML